MITVTYCQKLKTNSLIKSITFTNMREFRIWKKDNKSCGRTIIKDNSISSTMYSVISVSFGNVEKTYDYLLVNRSGSRVYKDQKVNVITGNSSIIIKHLSKYEKIPKHVTKQLILTNSDTAVIGLLERKEN